MFRTQAIGVLARNGHAWKA